MKVILHLLAAMAIAAAVGAVLGWLAAPVVLGMQ